MFGLLHSGLVWLVFILVYTTLLWFNFINFGLARVSYVYFGLFWFGLVWFGLVWFGLVWFGWFVWFGLVCESVVGYSEV